MMQVSSHSEKDDRSLVYLEMEEASWFVLDGAAKMAADDAVPQRLVQLVELVPDVVCDVDLVAELLHGFVRAGDRVAYHVLGHGRFLDDDFVRAEEL